CRDSGHEKKPRTPRPDVGRATPLIADLLRERAGMRRAIGYGAMIGVVFGAFGAGCASDPPSNARNNVGMGGQGTTAGTPAQPNTMDGTTGGGAGTRPAGGAGTSPSSM